VLDNIHGLTQVLADITYTYLYGNGRIAQYSATTEYFLGDALGSVRQLTDASGEVTLAKRLFLWQCAPRPARTAEGGR